MTKQVYILIIIVVVIAGILIGLQIKANQDKAKAQIAALQNNPNNGQLNWVSLINNIVGGVAAGIASNQTKK